MCKLIQNRINTGALRSTLGNFPTGVAVVTARNGDEPPVGMTINSFCSLSLNPALVAWSIDRRAASYDCFQRCGQYTVSILAADQSDLARRFATRGADKFSGIDCDDQGGPRIPGACAWLRCKVYRRVIVGDHLMLIGQVMDFARSGSEPLVFSQGEFAAARAFTDTTKGRVRAA